MTLIEKCKEFLRKDSGGNNESTKLRYVVRIILCFCVLYNMISTVTSGIQTDTRRLIYYVVFFVIFIFALVMSYILRTGPFMVLFNFDVLVWVCTSVMLYGWSAGLQMLLVMLLVLIYFTEYKKFTGKIIYSVFLLLVRIGLYIFSIGHDHTLYGINGRTIYMQILNSILAYASISVISYIFSSESQALEGKLVEYNIQLVNQANTDPLTGLNNRRCTMECFEKLISDPRAYGCVSIADIDFFKKVNDSYGHDIGDKVLKSIAQTMVSTLGSDCVVSRWGGEEFLIVFPNVNGDSAYIQLQNLRNAISRLRFEVKDRSFTISLTYGLTEYDYRSDIQSTIKEADDKLYMGKENGRDQIVF